VWPLLHLLVTRLFPVPRPKSRTEQASFVPCLHQDKTTKVPLVILSKRISKSLWRHSRPQEQCWLPTSSTQQQQQQQQVWLPRLLFFCVSVINPPFPDLPLSHVYTLFGQLVSIHCLFQPFPKPIHYLFLCTRFTSHLLPLVFFHTYLPNQFIHSLFILFYVLRFYYSVFISSFPCLPKARSISVDPAQIGLVTR
jgi:hypothetical protein